MKDRALDKALNSLSLFKRLIQGDRHALELLYKENYDLLLNYGLKCNPDKDFVEDCIQDLFIDLFQNSHIRMERLVSVRAYLLKALRNNLAYKTIAINKQSVLEDFEFNVPIDEGLFDYMFPKDDEEMRLGRQLVEAISKLSSKQKAVLYLRYVKGFAHSEIAEALNIHVQSSMNLSNRALTKLRDILGGAEGDAFPVRLLILMFLKIFLK